MGFTFLELTNRILSMGQQNTISSLSTTSSEWGYKAQNAVNDALKELSLRLKIKTRQVEFQFDTVVGQQYYTITKRIMYPFVTLRLASVLGKIINTPPIDYDKLVTEEVGTGNPDYYYLAGYSGVLGQPDPGGEKLKVFSSTGDTGVVTIQGWDAYDNYMSEEVTLNGTTEVKTTYEFAYVDSISKGVTNGTITIATSGSDSFTLLQMARKENHCRYPVIALSSIPETATTIYGRGYLVIPDLINSTDVPLGLNELATNAIIAVAYAKFLEYDPKITTWSRASAWQLADREIALLIKNDKQDGIQYSVKPPICSRPIKQYFRPLDRGGY